MKSRAIQRGKRLDADCTRANTTTHEYGKDDDRVFCYGLYGDTAYELRDESYSINPLAAKLVLCGGKP